MKSIVCSLFFCYAVLLLSSMNISAETLSTQHPNDANMGTNPNVLFHEDFENEWGKWDYPSHDTNYLFLEKSSNKAHHGKGFLRSTVTAFDLKNDPYISAAARYTLTEPVENIYWRFYARFSGNSPTPHHWVRLGATDGNFDVRGKANTLPEGDKAFWLALDINDDDLFFFYTYWYNMRSGRCNDGTATDGCAGDQGTTYYYGNSFKPAGQQPLQRDQWFCVEVHAKTNSIGHNDGSLSLWINDKLVGDYRQGQPTGTWLRNTFHTGGCRFAACTEPEPFEGFNFRNSEEVKFRQIFMDTYYQRNTFNRKKSYLHKKGKNTTDEQTVLYDDIVVATERIGCMINRKKSP